MTSKEVEGLAMETEEIRKAHKVMNKRLDSIEISIGKIEKAIEPIVTENQFRRRLDDKVTRWLPRVPYIAMIIAAIIYFVVYKSGLPFLNQATG